MTLSLTGSILQKYAYSDYGERNLDSKTEILDNEFGYNGEAHTGDGLQYLNIYSKSMNFRAHITWRE